MILSLITASVLSAPPKSQLVGTWNLSSSESTLQRFGRKPERPNLPKNAITFYADRTYHWYPDNENGKWTTKGSELRLVVDASKMNVAYVFFETGKFQKKGPVTCHFTFLAKSGEVIWRPKFYNEKKNHQGRAIFVYRRTSAKG